MLELVDKATAPLKEIYGSSTQSSKALQAQRDELIKLNKAQGNIDSFRQLSSALKQTKADLEDAQSSAAHLALEYSKTEKPTRSMTKQFELARQKVKQLKQAEQEQNVQLSLLRSGLKEAGISTKNLANEEKALKPKIDAVNKSLDKKKLQLEKQVAIQKRLNAITRQYKKTQELMGNMTSSGLGAGAAAATGGAAMIVPIKLSIDFESAMADVKKVIDFDTPQQFKQMNDDIISLSKRLPMTANEIAQIVALGGQSGIKKSELLVFAEDAVKMGVAFDITAEESGQAMAEMRTAFKMSQNEVTALSDKINYLGNNSPAAAKSIMNIVQRIGPLGEVGGFASGSIAALGATIKGMGVEEEIAATGIKNLMLALVAGESATKGQKAAFEDLGLNSKQIAQSMQKDAEGTTLKVLKAVSKLDKYKQAAVLKDLFGSESLGSIAPLLTNMDALQKNLGMVSDQTKYAGSMQAEYAARSKTTQNNLQLFTNGLKATGITIGNNLLPSLNELLTEVRGIIDMMQNWASKHPVLVGNISKVILVIIALLAAISAISLGIVALLGPMALMRMMFGVLGVKGFGLINIIKMIGTAFLWLGSSFLKVSRFFIANPIIFAILVIAGLAYLIYRNWGPIKAFFSDIWNSIKSGASQLWQSLVGFFSSGIANISTVILNWSPMGLFYKVFASVMSYFGIQLPSTFTGFGQMLMQGLANGIGNTVGAVITKAKEVTSKITNTVKGAFGIHSPSRVFAELGAYNMQGLAIGIDKNSSLPAAAVSNASKDMLGSFDTSGIRFDTRPSISSQSPRAAAATATPMQLTINVYPSAGMDEKSLAQMVAAEVAKFQRAPTSNPRSYNDID